MNVRKQSAKAIQVARWVARFASILSIAVISLFLFGSDEPQQFAGGLEVMGFLLFPVGVVLGMAAAWRWEFAGGLLTAVSLVAFYIWHLATSGKLPTGPWFLILALPGLALLVLGLTGRNLDRRR